MKTWYWYIDIIDGIFHADILWEQSMLYAISMQEHYSIIQTNVTRYSNGYLSQLPLVSGLQILEVNQQ